LITQSPRITKRIVERPVGGQGVEEAEGEVVGDLEDLAVGHLVEGDREEDGKT
jgi:hypothetical protein